MDALRIFKPQYLPDEKSRARLAYPSLIGSANAFLSLAIVANKTPRVLLVVAPGLKDADILVDDLEIINKNFCRVLEFPPLLSDEKTALATRLKTVAALRAWQLNPYPCIVVAPASALSLKVSTQKDIGINIASLSFKELGDKLSAAGYTRVSTVEREGDFSIRGGIVDAWGPGEEFPFRVEFFGDELESIRAFDSATQRSIEKIKDATLLPILETENSQKATLLDFLPRETALLALEHFSYDAIALERFSFAATTGEPAPQNFTSSDFLISALPGFSELSSDEAHHPELFAAARARLEKHIAIAKAKGKHILEINDLSGGFETDDFLVVTKADRVFTRRKTRAKKVFSSTTRVNTADELDPGEYVVHLDYGIGKFIGSSEIFVDGARREVFSVEYDGGAIVHVPATHAHLLSRYVGVKGESVKLHRLDGKRWTRDKASAQKAVQDLAASLLDTQARRELTPGFSYNLKIPERDAFDAAFSFEETADQLDAIKAIESDMASPKAMDRLICGDAGYGKTEVAMRAAFIAAMNGKQTAVLAPTTVLAEQHFETFTSRFDGTPIRIEAVSRFQSQETHKKTFDRLRAGVCDIVIGTHAILSSKISFKDLGLIIIDEEQRFGVRHKEFLKRLRSTADVLTLSATPIPRTLYLSMIGARDLSLLRSPPRTRVAVETTIVKDSDLIVKHAIENELSRDGQVFFLHNRVSTIYKVEKRLLSINPKWRIVVAHGQMDGKELARKMRDFERGKFDILLSTTIIESGIDIPRANTILVDQAHTFGLADLYQLRGRVGRAARQGYAVFLLPGEGLIDSDARERLAALKRHSALGAGFNLAVRDLELRGAGNLLGSEQSGHIAAVGFTLYCQLLKRTISQMKGEKVRSIIDVKLSLDFIDLSPSSEQNAAALPYNYVEDDGQRMSFMKRLAEAADVKDVKSIATELQDRFGPLPDSATRLIRVAELRVRCALSGITSLSVANARAIFSRNNEILFVHKLRATTGDKKLNELLALCKTRPTLKV